MSIRGPEAVMREARALKGALLLAALFAALSVLSVSAVNAQEPREQWLVEFEDVCSRTFDAMSLTEEELQGLLARCDKLKPVIGQLDETRKKVYAKRLQMCRDLYAFALESKQSKKDAAAPSR